MMMRRSDLPWKVLGAAALVLAAGSCLLSVLLYTKIGDEESARQHELLERRSANCLVFEGDHLQEVQQLRQTYRFLTRTAEGRPKPRSRWTELEKVVFKTSLPKLELDARSDSDLHGAQVPRYCDQPGLGLPEPDPAVPKRPPELR